MSKCNECNKKIDLDSEAFYPYSNKGDENNPHELNDTPFCEECSNKILKTKYILTVLDTQNISVDMYSITQEDYEKGEEYLKEEYAIDSDCSYMIAPAHELGSNINNIEEAIEYLSEQEEN